MRILQDYSTFKILIKKLLCFKPFNSLLKLLLKPIIRLLPADCSRLPIVGTVKIPVGPNHTFFMYADGNDTIATALFWNGLDGFEKQTVSLFLLLLKHSKDNDIFLDIGANTGIYTLLAAIHSLKVFAFEPVPKIYKCLDNNLKLNHLDDVQIFPYAMSNTVGKTTLYIPQSTAIPTSASLVPGFKENCQNIEVESYTIDAFAEKHELTINLIKMDAEGVEIKILQGAKKVISKDKPLIICEVLPEGQEDLLENFFSDIGYMFFEITCKGLNSKLSIKGNYKNLNYLFIHQDYFKEIKDILPITSN